MRESLVGERGQYRCPTLNHDATNTLLISQLQQNIFQIQPSPFRFSFAWQNIDLRNNATINSAFPRIENILSATDDWILCPDTSITSFLQALEFRI